MGWEAAERPGLRGLEDRGAKRVTWSLRAGQTLKCREFGPAVVPQLLDPTEPSCPLLS